MSLNQQIKKILYVKNVTIDLLCTYYFNTIYNFSTKKNKLLTLFSLMSTKFTYLTVHFVVFYNKYSAASWLGLKTKSLDLVNACMFCMTKCISVITKRDLYPPCPHFWDAVCRIIEGWGLGFSMYNSTCTYNKKTIKMVFFVDYFQMNAIF